MGNEAYKEWYVQGLQALKSAAEQGREAASATSAAVTEPELKKLVEEGSQRAERNAAEIDRLLEKAKGGASSGIPNKIMEGIRAGNRQVVDAAKDPEVRDASVVAAAQIALHYYIAAYGTLASTAKHLGMTEDAQTFKRLTDEAKQQDERFTQIAEGVANKRAA